MQFKMQVSEFLMAIVAIVMEVFWIAVLDVGA